MSRLYAAQQCIGIVSVMTLLYMVQ